MEGKERMNITLGSLTFGTGFKVAFGVILGYFTASLVCILFVGIITLVGYLLYQKYVH